MFYLTDSDPASPPGSHWSWKKWLAILCTFLLVIFIFLVLHDERLEPYDDLRQQAAITPPGKDNGFVFLVSRWSPLPTPAKEDKELTREMTEGIVPWDPEHLEKVKTGRENVAADLDEALAMPHWVVPTVPGPGIDFSYPSTLMPPFHLLRLEVAGFLHEGREAEAFTGIERMHRLATRQLEGSSNLISYLVAMSLLPTVMDSYATFVEKSEADPETLRKLAGWWDQDLAIVEGFNRAIAGEAIFLESAIPTMKKEVRSGYSSSFKGYLATLFLKKNKTQNRMNRNLRKLMAVALLPYPDRAAAVAAGAAEGTAASPIIPAWLDLNFTGNELSDMSSYLKITPGILRHLFNARAFRVKIALHRWQADHGPGLPSTLGELVPDYLAKVPADPWNGHPLLWDQASGVIYAVGSDWTPDLPSVGHFRNKWFSDEHKSPGLRFARPPQPAPSAPATTPAATGTN